MTVPASPVKIINMALDQLKQRAINTIDPATTPEELLCERHYHHARRATLRMGVWNFAVGRVMLSRTLEVPEFDYTDKYLLPNDFVRLLSIGTNVNENYKRDYDIEGRHILINNSGSPDLPVKYIRDVEDVTLWDDLFRDVMVLKLALELAYPITGSKVVVERINSLLAAAIPDAVGVDGQERPPRRIQRSKYIDARVYGTREENGGGYYTVLP